MSTWHARPAPRRWTGRPAQAEVEHFFFDGAFFAMIACRKNPPDVPFLLEEHGDLSPR